MTTEVKQPFKLTEFSGNKTSSKSHEIAERSPKYHVQTQRHPLFLEDIVFLAEPVALSGL